MLFYLIGIKGSAMSGLAKLLLGDGHIVHGVDVEEDFYTCKGLEAAEMESFSSMKLQPSFFYIVGNAYVNHSVTNYIKKMKYHFAYYPQFIVQYYKHKNWICVSGSHGKTTTTKLLSSIFPNTTSLIGDGEVQSGTDGYFIIEACEYRNTFLNYQPYLSLILNVDYDHPDFFKTKEEYQQAFYRFIAQSTIAIVNGDEVPIEVPQAITFGRKTTNDVVFEYEEKGTKGMVKILNKPFELPHPGLHFAYDFVGAYLVSKMIGASDFQIQQAFDQFQMPKRRLEYEVIDTQKIFCDYAHHPTEIKAFYNGIRASHRQKIVAVFQPHTLSRLEAFIDEFKEALSLFEECYLMQIFTSCREVHQIVKEQELYHQLDLPIYSSAIAESLLNRDHIVLCFLGAGSIDQQYEKYLDMKKRSKKEL